MSPTPPNKDPNATNKDINSASIQNEQAINTDEFEIIDNNEEVDTSRVYRPLEQNSSETNEAEEDDDDDSENEDTDSEPELDPDEHFRLLASSRATTTVDDLNRRTTAVSYSHLCETDVFERKIVLESENIELDEEKTKKIKDLMQNFKLPDEAVPDWAKHVPEDVWKKNLLDCLSAKKQDLFNLTSTSGNNV